MAIRGLVFTKDSVSHKDGFTPYLRHAETPGLRYFAKEDIEQLQASEEDKHLLRRCSEGAEGVFTCSVSEVKPDDIEYLFCTLRQYFLLTGDTVQLCIPSVRGLSEWIYEKLLRLAEIYRINLYFVEDKLSRNYSAYIPR